MAPAVLQTLHAFENHSHAVCISKIENHTHEKNLDCKLDVLKKTELFLVNTPTNTTVIEHQFSIIVAPYHFLLHHQQLSFSLRGPPVLV